MEDKRKPLVSVIVPNYCHSKYLDERMYSILNQTYNNFEVIILDDCSPDNGASKTVIERYRVNPHVVHIVYNEKNSGSTFKQWDKGIKLAKGEYIWIAESDDSCESTMLEELVIPILGKDKISISFCRSVTFTNDKLANKIVGPRNIKTGCINGIKFIHEFMKSGNAIVNASSAIFRKSAFELIGNEYKTFRGAGDRLFWIYLAEKGDVCFVDKTLNYFRQHVGNTTASCNALGINQKEDKRILDYILKKGYVTRSEYAKIVKSYVIIHIYQMVNDEKLKKELYNVWGVSKMEQINIKYETSFPKISVIMPVFNVCQYLGGAIESVLSQTFQDFEILLIDDGSTDGSGIICDELKSLDSRISVFHIHNSGPSVARNLGLEYAKGKYIYCMDSDDYLENDAFAKIVEEMEEGYDIVSFNLVREDEQANVLWHSGHKSQKFRFHNLGELYEFLFRRFLCYHFGWENPTRLFRRDIIEKYKIRYPVKSRIGEDMCFCFCYMLHISSYIILEGEYYHYVKHVGTLLDKAKHRNNVHDIEQMLLHVVKHIKDFNLDIERYIPLIFISFLEMEFSRFRNVGFSDIKVGKIINASLSKESKELLRAFVSDQKNNRILTRQQCVLYKYDSILCISNGSFIKSSTQWFQMKFYNIMDKINKMFI